MSPLQNDMEAGIASALALVGHLFAQLDAALDNPKVDLRVQHSLLRACRWQADVLSGLTGALELELMRDKQILAAPIVMQSVPRGARPDTPASGEP